MHGRLNNVAEFELTELKAIPNQFPLEEVDLSLEIANNGQADGSAALIVELVESGSAKGLRCMPKTSKLNQILRLSGKEF